MQHQGDLDGENDGEDVFNNIEDVPFRRTLRKPDSIRAHHLVN